jgi:hypothetical protein
MLTTVMRWRTALFAVTIVQSVTHECPSSSNSSKYQTARSSLNSMRLRSASIHGEQTL